MATITLGVDSRPAVKGAKQYRDAMGRFVKKPSQAAAGSIKKVDAQMKTLGTTALAVKGALAPLFASFAAFSVVSKATKVIAGFEETMATLQGVTGLDKLSDDFVALEARARDLGATTRFSAQEAADGLLFLARAGQSAEESMASIGPTLDLATAAGIGLAEAADITSNLLGPFKLAAKDTERVADVLLNTANSAKTDVQKMAEAFKQVAPIAGTLGLSLEEVAAAIGTVGQAAIASGSAGTSLRTAIVRLIKPPAEAEKAILGLGLSLNDVNPQIVGIAGAFDNLAKAGLSAQDASAIFAQEALGLGLTLTENVKKLRELTKANEESNGITKKNAELLSNTLTAAYLSLQSAISEVFLIMGEKGLLAALKNVLKTVTGAILILAGMEDKVKDNKAAAMALVSALKSVGSTIAAIALAKTTLLFFNLAKSVLTAVKSVRLLTIAMAANPIGLVVVAIGLLVAAYELLKDETVQIGDETVLVADIAGAAWDHFADKFIFVVDTIQKVWKIGVDFLADSWKKYTLFVELNFKQLTDVLGADWGEVIDFIVKLAKGMANNTIAIFASVLDAIGTVIASVTLAGKALLDFDPAKPLESLEKIVSNLDPVKILGTIGDDVGRNFGKDFVGGFLADSAKFKQEMASALNATFGESFTQDLNTFFNPLAAGEDIRERALERARQRKAAEGTGGEGGTGDMKVLTDQAKALNDELSKLDQGGDIKIKLEVDGLNVGEKLTDSAKAARMEIEQLFKELEFEATLVGLTNEERSKSIALREFEALAIAGQVEGLEELKRKFEELLDLATDKGKLGTERLAANFGELGESLKNVLDDAFSPERLEELARNLSATFTDAIGDVIDGTKSLKEAFESVVRGVQEAFVENFLLKPVQGIFDNIFNSLLQNASGFSLFADGGVIDSGRKQFFAGGDVFTSPTTFPMRGGDTGVLGEQGPEGILPLARGGDGKLGVKSLGGGGGTVVNNDNRKFNVGFSFPNAKTADDFRPARRQVVRDFQRATDG